MSRPTELDGWINDDEKQANFVRNWKYCNIINPKYIYISFFSDNGFQFQE